jgi:general secretion pathway protein A
MGPENRAWAHASEGFMYEAFYGLREKPFNLTPDPKYLYLSDKHKEAFAHLLFGIKNRTGFVMVTGEIGTGKTTICRNLLNQLDPETELAFVFNPSLNPVELLKRINSEFGLASEADNILELTDTLNAHLLDAASRGKNCVLVIDEAQNLTPPVLEQIRLLSNLETETEKLLQIILIGQPELLERLQLKELRQLNQRITARYHLKPLNEQETLQYIAYRLHVAGGRRKVQFARSAVRAVYRQSGGTPRVINAICDRALLIGYTKETHEITAALVRRAAHEIRGERVAAQHGRWQTVRRWIPSPAMLVAVALVAVLVRFFAMPLEQAARELGMFNTMLRNEIPPAESVPASPVQAGAVTGDSAQASEKMAALLQDSVVARRVLERLSTLAEPQAPSASPSSAAFAERLAGMDPVAARDAAAGALLRAWNLALVSGPPDGDTVESLAAFARQNGFAHEALAPAVEQLVAVDLPAFVKMKSGDKTFWMALLAADGPTLAVSGSSPEDRLEVTREAFRAHFADEAVVLWRDPAPGTPVMGPGRGGKAVAELKRTLRQLGRLTPGNTGDAYDGPTAMAVSRIQAETGLLIDGIAGKQVRMIMNSWSPDVPGPSLKGDKPVADTAPEPAPPAVAAVPPAPAPKAKKPPKNPAPVPEIATAPEAPAPPAPESPPVVTPPAAEPAPPETETVTPPEAAPPDPEVAPTPPAPEPAVPEAPAGDALVEVQELPQPGAAERLDPVDTSALKESTPPAQASPLVPHAEEANP